MSTNLTKQNIPKEWERVPLKEVVDFLDNQRVPLSSAEREHRKGEYPYYGASGIIDYIDDYLFDGEYVLLGEDGANILDRSSRMAYIAKGKIWVNNHAHVLKARENVLTYFIAEYLEKIDYRAYNTGSAQPKLNRAVCEKIPFLLPPMTEQESIVKVLKTWDEAIEKLGQMIAIKREVKKGLMQKLLTGELRLPGFKGEWKEGVLKEWIDSLIVPMRDKPKVFDGDIPWCRIEDFNGIYLSDSLSGQYVSEAVIDEMNLKVYPKGTLLVSCSANLGRCAIVEKPLVTNQTFIGLVMNEEDSFNLFFYYYMGYHSKRLNQLSTGTTITYLSRDQFEKFKVSVPDRVEQEAIAKVLVTADEEINLLVERLNKIKDQKKYLLNNLVTGQIRTPENL